jgi:hypothetical protein
LILPEKSKIGLGFGQARLSGRKTRGACAPTRRALQSRFIAGEQLFPGRQQNMLRPCHDVVVRDDNRALSSKFRHLAQVVLGR